MGQDRDPSRLRSQRWFAAEGMRAFSHRQRMQQMGFRRDELVGRPVIAVLNTWSDLSPCHAHLRERAEAVKRGIWRAGGAAVELPALSLGEVIGWMAQAPEVEVICAYAEGIRESARFTAALDLARRNRKPVVMMKVGRSELGGHAANSHTASIAGDDTITQAVLDEFGVVRANTTEQMLGLAPLGAAAGAPTIPGL